MLLHKPFIVILTTAFILLGSLHAQNFDYTYTSYKVLPESRIELQGTTNINEFNCYTLELVPEVSALVLPAPKSQSILLKNSTVKIKVKSLECGKEAINRDLKKTLKGDDYPEILIGLNQINFEEDKSNKITINASLEVAGTTKPANLNLTGEFDSKDSIYYIEGKYKIRLTDFNIEPPQPLFGLIKVHDEIVISFDLALKHDNKTADLVSVLAEEFY